MKKFFVKLPYPIAGLMLAYAALGNLLEAPLGANVKLICGAISAILLILILIKMLVLPESIKNTFNILPIASVMATLPMGMMLLSVYVKPYATRVALILWAIGLIINVIIVIGFSGKYLFPWKLENVFASYFVTYVGIVVASVTAKAFHMEAIGIGAFVFGLICYLILIPIVVTRYMKHPISKDPLKPLIIIFAAPANLLVVGYISLGLTWSIGLLTLLWGLGLLTTLFAWYQLTRLYRLDFYPSYSAYTFPLVIGAISTLRYYNYMANGQNNIEWIHYFGVIQIAIAVAAVSYVTLRYILFLMGKENI
jgi:exfoliative toxin A/B